MKLRAPLQGLGIRARVVILALLPVVGAVTMIGYNLAASRLEDAERHLAERASLIARNLALASEFALFSNNETLLKDMLRGVATDTEVRWAAVWDRRRGTLVSHGQGPSDYQADRLFASLETEQPLPDGCYGAPIRAQALSIDDFGEQLLASPGASPRAATDVLGYAAIEVAPDRLVASRNAIVVNTTLIALGSLLGSFLIALWLGNSITDPVMRLIKAVRELRGGKLGARVDVRAGGELGRLEEGVNGMAASLEHSQQVLRERVEQATAALRHTVAELEERNLELDEARRLALKAGAERTEFLARMSHEIRTPLNAIVGFTRLLQRGDDNVEHLGTIQRAAEQLLHVINDILQFIRLDADADQLEVVEFDVASVLEDAVSMLAPMANEKDLELVLLPHSDLPISVWSDPGRLSQVVVNLVNNAIKFTEQGHVVVEAKRTINEHGWHQVEVSVSDTGIGLTPAQQAQVFRAFAQSDSSITRRFGGTGLGLSIAERLVKLMHGEIGVESVKGRGSRFWFRIPCTDCAAAPPIEVGGPLSGKRLLVYDGNPFVRRGLRGMLAGWGALVFNAGKWEKLLALLAPDGDAAEPAALLVGLSPVERQPAKLNRLMRQIRARFSGPVILLTGSEHWVPPAAVRASTPVRWTVKPARRATFRRLLASQVAGGDAMPSTLPGPGAPALPSLQVLVAEDNEFNRLLLRHLLEEQGATVDEAMTGLAAIGASRCGCYDCILMDLHMPEMDGAEAARRIRAELGDQAPPIIALTADLFGREAVDGLGEVFDDWLIKPIDTDQLIARLASLVEIDADAASARPGPRQLPEDLRRRYALAVRGLSERIGEAEEVHDVTTRRRLMHDLKGIGGLFGSTRVRGLITELDTALEADDGPAVKRLLGAIRDSADELLRSAEGRGLAEEG